MDTSKYGTRHIVTDINDLHSIFKAIDTSIKPLFCDTEGEHLYDHSELKVLQSRLKRIEAITDLHTRKLIMSNAGTSLRLLQMYHVDIPYIFLVDLDYIPLDTVKELLQPMWTVWVNAPYDFGSLNMVTRRFDDLQLLARNAYPSIWRDNQKVSLDLICKYLIPFETYDKMDKKKLQSARFLKGSILTEEQLHYAEVDVIVMAVLWELEPIQAVRELPFYKLDMKSLRHSNTIQANGIKVNVDKLPSEIENTQLEIDETQRVLGVITREIYEDSLPTPKPLKEDKIGTPFNSGSYIQVRALFTHLLGVHQTKSDGDYMIELQVEYPDSVVSKYAKAIYDSVRAKKQLTMLESINFDEVITKFNPYGTKTGRYSSNGKDVYKGINAQNMKRGLMYLLEYDTKDTTTIHADYGTAELRTACAIMGDITMYGYLKDRVDLHKVSAMMANKALASLEDVDKPNRQKGKAVSFGFIFDMGWRRFKEYAFTDYGVLFTDAEAKAVKEEYNRTYIQGTIFRAKKWAEFENTPEYTPLGRCVLATRGNEAINFATQGGIGETCKLAIDIMLDYDEATGEYLNDYHKYLYLQIHDAMVSRVPNNKILEVSYFKIKAMLEAWDILCSYDMMLFKDIPMEVEFEFLDYTVVVYTIDELKEWARTVSIVKDGIPIPQDSSKLHKELG